MRIEDIKKAAIIGAGLMGGSLALALKEKFPSLSVWGYARSQKTYNKLKNLNILHHLDKDLKEVVKNADLVVLALPVYAIIEYLTKITPFLKEKAVVFDLGSTKGLITKHAQKELPKNVNFVGCHPLCGSEKSGAEFSRKDLYEKTVCLITSSPKRKETQLIKNLWEKIGSRVVFTSPVLHDKILSSVSHIPHLVSFSLTQFINKNYLEFSTTSLKDLTRISNSVPSIWTDIFLSNKENIIKDIEKYITVLQTFKKSIAMGDSIEILKLINEVNKKQELINLSFDSQK